MASDSPTDRLPYWTFFPSDFVSSVGWWPQDAIGAHILILCHAWLNGPLTNTHLEAMLRGLSAESASLVRERLIQVDGGWTHPRLHRDREAAIQRAEMYREAGRRGQEVRRSKGIPAGSQPTTPPDRGATSPPGRVATRGGGSPLDTGGWGMDSSDRKGVQGEGEWPPVFVGTADWFARLHRFPSHAVVTQAGIDGQMRVCARMLESESLARPLASRLLRSLAEGWAVTGKAPSDALQGILDGLDDEGVKDRGAVLRSRVSKFLERAA